MIVIRLVLFASAVLAAGPAVAANKPIIVTSGVDDGTDGSKVTLREAFKQQPNARARTASSSTQKSTRSRSRVRSLSPTPPR